MSDESEAVATGRDDPVATAKCSVCGDDDHSAEWKHAVDAPAGRFLVRGEQHPIMLEPDFDPERLYSEAELDAAAARAADDDEMVPVCGASKQQYICVRPPDHDEGQEQVVHIGMTDRGMIVQWIDGESGVKIRPMTFEEKRALSGELPDEITEAVAGITEFAIGRLSVQPGDVVLIHTELGVEEVHHLTEALIMWSEREGLDLHWLILPPAQIMVLHPDALP